MYKKKVDLNSKAGKYFLAKRAGKTKKESAVVAGYTDHNNTSHIEETKTYQAIEKKYYKDVLLQNITLEEIAIAHAQNITQKGDRGARNKAIEMAVGRIEPQNEPKEDYDKLIVVLKS